MMLNPGRSAIRRLIAFVVALLVSSCSTGGVRTEVSGQEPADSAGARLAGVGRWYPSAGTIGTAPDPEDASRNVMRWTYPLSSDAIFIFTRDGLHRFRGAKGVHLRVRSDRAGQLAIRMDYKNGNAFWTRFDVGETWTELALASSAIRHVAGKENLDLNKVATLYLVDLSGQDDGWTGERTVWVDYLRPDTGAVPAPQAATSSAATGSKSKTNPPLAYPTKSPIPGTRPFYMAMTPWPYDFTPEAIHETYVLIAENTDMVGHHFDDGVPWPEANAGKPFHRAVRENCDFRTSQLEGHKVYLVLTPISWGRDNLAAYWEKDSNQPLPRKWKKKNFDDPEVIDAYVAYCRRMIEQFRPTYLTYGIEVNMLRERNPKAFVKFVTLAGEVYERLKAEHPDLPRGLTFHVGTFSGSPSEQREALEQLLPFTDFIGVSSYPYGEADRRGDTTFSDPDSIPRDWFRRIRDLAPGKLFAIAETGFLAEPFTSKKYHANVPGNPEWQADYLRWLLNEAYELDAELVMWFVPRDYDLFWKKLEKLSFDDIAKTWRDTGLWDESGRARPALNIWRQWLELPLERRN
jgi:hypothetical protein